jgi:hypothetical protein
MKLTNRQVYSDNSDDGHRGCPKHVEFLDKITSGYLTHLVGYFIRTISCSTRVENNLSEINY